METEDRQIFNVSSTKKKVSKSSDKLKESVKKKSIKKDKEVEAIGFDSLEGRFLLVKVGNDAHPADSKKIKDIEIGVLIFVAKMKRLI